MIMRWLSCGTRSMHIVGTCPDCLCHPGPAAVWERPPLGTPAGFRPSVSTAVESIDYYIDSTVEKIGSWIQ